MDPTRPKAIAEAANMSLQVADKLLGYAQELQPLFARVVSMPRRALLDLEEIFDEVRKSLEAIDAATKTFFKAIENPAQFVDNDDQIHDMSSSRLPNLVEEKRGHCDEIGHIYDRYLNGILSNLFQDEADRSKAENILTRLGHVDYDLFRDLTHAAEKMRDLAKEAYRLRILGKRGEAIDLVQNAGLTLLDMREKFNDAYVEMTRIKSEFVKAGCARDTCNLDLR